MTDTQRRLAAATDAAAARQRRDPGSGSRRGWATVTVVDYGPPPTVTVEFEPGGTPVGPLRYFEGALAPQVGDYVFLVNVDGDVIVFGRMAATALWSALSITRNLIVADYTLELTDAFNVRIVHDSASPHSVTFPPHATVAIPVGTSIEFYAKGPGQLALVEGAGVTFDAPRGKKSATQGATFGAVQDETNVWVISGDTTT